MSSKGYKEIWNEINSDTPDQAESFTIEPSKIAAYAKAVMKTHFNATIIFLIVLIVVMIVVSNISVDEMPVIIVVASGLLAIVATVIRLIYSIGKWKKVAKIIQYKLSENSLEITYDEHDVSANLSLYLERNKRRHGIGRTIDLKGSKLIMHQNGATLKNNLDKFEIPNQLMYFNDLINEIKHRTNV